MTFRRADASDEDGDGAFMTPAQIRAAQPASWPADHGAALGDARRRMEATGQWTTTQAMGRRWPIGCAALEITQRCNLDCTACYLSEHSELVKDLPLEEVFRRIDMIFAHYGPSTSVQVTGGDPTLRKRDELIAIIRHIRGKGMHAALFTNGIRVTRGLLEEMAAAGLTDIVFHVDMTQERRGYNSEVALNAIRRRYIDLARGLPVVVMFNTTVFKGNLDQIPEVVKFFVSHSDIVRLASFQPVALTGRGSLDSPAVAIETDVVIRRIERGANTTLSFDAARFGHAHCNRCAMTLVANGKVHDLLDDAALYEKVLDRTARLRFDRRFPKRVLRTFLLGLLANPTVVVAGAGWLGRKLWRMKGDLLAARGRVHKLTFFVHNFMDSCRLEQGRVDACIFMAATRDGPISMCLHNAKRDAFILQPVRVGRVEEGRFWDPLSGRIAADDRTEDDRRIQLDRKTAKGRATSGLGARSHGG